MYDKEHYPIFYFIGFLFFIYPKNFILIFCILNNYGFLYNEFVYFKKSNHEKITFLFVRS